jgi:homoserine dehydrogenase
VHLKSPQPTTPCQEGGQARLVSSSLRIVLIGHGNVGKAFSRLLAQRRSVYPFRIVGVLTRRGTAYNSRGLEADCELTSPAASVPDFLDHVKPDVVIEITTLNPESGEPALGHIRAALERHMHVITANKGPIAYAYADLCDLARRMQVELRFESTVMDGSPVFNMVRNNLPGAKILGFTGVVNSTSKVIVAAMERGLSMEEGIAEAQALGIAEADAWYDVDGWDSAAKAAALANVLMDARITPKDVRRSGLRDLPPNAIRERAQAGETTVLVSRAARAESGALSISVTPESVAMCDLLGAARGTSNLLLLHTDVMGTLGIVSIDPGVEQTAYGLFSDLVDVARSV